MQAKRIQRGVTLIETAAASAIVAIATGLAAPSFQTTLAKRALDGSAAQLAVDLHYIRSEAVARNAPLRIGFHTGAAESCYVIHTGSAGDCTCAAGATTCVPGAQEFKTVHFPATGRIQLQSNSASMLFHPVRGTATPAGTLRLVGPNGQEVRHVVNILGRTRSCSPQGAVKGYPVC